MNVHIAIVTGHLEPLLIPLLQSPPDKIIFLCSTRMRDNVEICEQILTDKLSENIEISVRHDVPDSDPAAIWKMANTLANELDISDQFTFNLTGGTKLMSTLVERELSFLAGHNIYVDTRAGCIYRFAASDSKLDAASIQTIPQKSVMNLDTCLQANGMQRNTTLSEDTDWRSACESRKPLTKIMARDAAKMAGLFRSLNAVIRGNGNDGVIKKGERRSESLDPNGHRKLKYAPPKATHPILKKAAELGIVGWDKTSPQDLYFDDLEGARYLSGGWLEEYVWLTVRDAGIEDVQAGMKIGSVAGRKNDVGNEIDCAAAHLNRTILFEAKTGNLSADSKDQDVLHKLLSMSEQTGALFNTRVLVLAQGFGLNENRERNIRRARVMGITVIEGEQLKSLPGMLKTWCATGALPSPGS